jgi:hypothetical protein
MTMKPILRSTSVFLAALLFTIVLAGCSGCSQVGSWLQTDNGQLATQLTVMKVIENAPDPAYRAQRIRVVVGQINAFLDSPDLSTITLASIEVKVRSEVAWTQLSPSETLLVNQIVKATMTDLATRLGSGGSPPSMALTVEQIKVVRQVLDTILQAVSAEGY